jgi:hypothetical protein
MSRAKVFTSILMVLILISLSGASVWAAPGRQEPTVEPTEEPTVEPTEEPTVEPTEEPTAEPTEEPPDEEPPTVHPVASALAEFFADTLGLDYEMIMDCHEDGMGLGVIAQACWMASMLYDPEAETNIAPGDILEAKKSGDFSCIELPDGETPTNWGQLRKAVLGSEKAQKNLGAIMSGRAEGEQEQEQETTGATKQGQDKSKKGKGPGEGGDGPLAEPSGEGKDKGKGNEDSGPPAEPPGKDKEGGKDKGGGKGKGK